MPLPSEISHAGTGHPGAGSEYSREERKLLLQLAHAAIVSTLEKCDLDASLPPAHLAEFLSGRLAEPRGAFTTLYARGKLRGCVGYPTGLLPLYRTIVETARAAAFDDPRFVAVTLAEAPELLVSLSVLSPLRPILPDAIEIGRHGLLITSGSRRGLLLPQVPVEHGWDRTTFLEQTCAKASLPPDAWRNPQIKIEAFTAESFADAGCEE
jgi:AmmeMemoRadiSam system protein A